MKFKIVEEHKSDNIKPIIIKKGEKIKVGERSDGSENWDGWIYCYSLNGIGEGWTPQQIIQINGEYGTVLEDYSAKELEVKKDEIVEGNKELNGWVWCSKLNGAEEDWLPREKLYV